MSKKKNKFKKKKTHQLNNVLTSNQAVDLANPISESLEENFGDTPRPTEDVKPDAYKTDKYDHVKKDIKKILVIMLIVILLLVVIYILSLRTSFLGTFGNWLYRVLNIQAS